MSVRLRARGTAVPLPIPCEARAGRHFGTERREAMRLQGGGTGGTLRVLLIVLVLVIVLAAVYFLFVAPPR